MYVHKIKLKINCTNFSPIYLNSNILAIYIRFLISHDFLLSYNSKMILFKNQDFLLRNLETKTGERGLYTVNQWFSTFFIPRTPKNF